MRSIQFLGACGLPANALHRPARSSSYSVAGRQVQAGMVTGSSYLLTGDSGEQILVDLGMYQEGDELGKLNFEPLGFDSTKISGVLLTHAHLDHCGRLPLLLKAGYTGKIYMTKATRMLAALVLADAAKIAAESVQVRQTEIPRPSDTPFNKGGKGDFGTEGILYTEEDVDNLLNIIEVVEYDQAFSIGDFSIVFRDAGHILGSGSIEVTDTEGKRIVFSGDLGNTPEDMIRPTEQVKKAEYVIMESTYGDRLHRDEDPSVVLQEEINEIEKSGGVLLIPSFSIERAQELLHRINHLKNTKKIGDGTKVFLDSPMAIRATEIFRRSPELYNKELTKEMKTDDPFGFPGLVLTGDAEESKKILLSPAPKVIISGSGMMHGGRILHHAMNYLADPKTRLLLVGYQAPGTLGRALLDGAKKVMIYNQEIPVGANVREVEAMSSHADQKKLLKWLGGIKDVKKVFLTHGEDGARKALEEKIKEEVGIKDVFMPALNQVVEF